MKKNFKIIICILLFSMIAFFVFASENLFFEISLSKPYLNIGETGRVPLSVANPYTNDINVDITLTVGNGVEMRDIELGDQCGGSMCKLDRMTIPSGGKEDIMKTLDNREKEILKLLLESKENKLYQSQIQKQTSISKATLSRLIKRLENGNIIEVRPSGNTNLILLQEWFMKK